MARLTAASPLQKHACHLCWNSKCAHTRSKSQAAVSHGFWVLGLLVWSLRSCAYTVNRSVTGRSYAKGCLAQVSVRSKLGGLWCLGMGMNRSFRHGSAFCSLLETMRSRAVVRKWTLGGMLSVDAGLS